MYTLERYSISISDLEDETCSFKLQDLSAATTARRKDRRKLYIIKSKESILYIGETSTSIDTRFQRGFTSFNYYIRNKKARGGYKGYKWIDRKLNPHRNLTVHVAVFDPTFDPIEKRSIIEAIEGELVFLTRNEFKTWPTFQNEIHFQPGLDLSSTAREIFDRIKGE